VLTILIALRIELNCRMMKKLNVFLMVLVFFSCKTEITTKSNNEKIRKESIEKKIENLIDNISPSSFYVEKEESKVFKPLNFSLLGKKNDIEKHVKISDTLLRYIRKYEETIDKDLIDIIGKYNFYIPEKKISWEIYFDDIDRMSLINFCNLLNYNYFTSLIFSNSSTIWMNGNVEIKFSDESIQKAKLFLDETIYKSKFWPLLSSKRDLIPFKISWKDKAEIILSLHHDQIKSNKWIKKDYGNKFYVNIPFKMIDVSIKDFDYSTVKKLLSYEGNFNSLSIKINVLETHSKILPSLRDMAESGLLTHVTNYNLINNSKDYYDIKIDRIKGLKQITTNKLKDSSNQEVIRQSLLFKEYNKYWDITFEYAKDNFLDSRIVEKIISTLEFSN
jgi:hypothetical protein